MAEEEEEEAVVVVDRYDESVFEISNYHLVHYDHYSLKNTVVEEVVVVHDSILAAELERKKQ